MQKQASIEKKIQQDDKEHFFPAQSLKAGNLIMHLPHVSIKGGLATTGMALIASSN
jgi:hypothetical protein